MAPRETENNAYAKIGLTNKEHYSVLWYFLEWSIEIVHFDCKCLAFMNCLKLQSVQELQITKD